MGDLVSLINDVQDKNLNAIKLIGDAFGTASQVFSAIGVVNTVINLFSQPVDPTQAALKNILTAIQNDFTAFRTADRTRDIITKLQGLDAITGPAQTELVQLLAHMPADIVPCITALQELALNADAFGAYWQIPYLDQVFWTDTGKYIMLNSNPMVDAGYGQQSPPNADSVFNSAYVLPDLLRTAAIFIAVAGSVDPNFTVDYKTLVLRPISTFLRTIHDIMVNGIKQLSPWPGNPPQSWHWTGQTLWEAVTFPPAPDGEWIATGATPIPFGFVFVPPLPPPITGANIEFGAVEINSGYSSMADYKIDFSAIGKDSTDLAPSNKFQIRLLKRSIDVYKGMGLPRVWGVINTLNALIGDPPMPRPNFFGWSFRQILKVSNFPADPATNKFSLYSLAKFIKHTVPFDTRQQDFVSSFQEALSY